MNVKCSTGLKIPEIIQEKFKVYSDDKRWCFCNKNKTPVEFRNPRVHFSRTDYPELGLLTLDELIEWSPSHVGFGIVTGNGLGCMDFDRFLENGKPRYDNKINEFLDTRYTRTFAELSTSDKGIHSFYSYDSEDTNIKKFSIDIKKFGVNLHPDEIKRLESIKDLIGGEFYVNQFIKMTGRPYNDNTYPINHWGKLEYPIILKMAAIISELPVMKKHVYQSSLNGNYKSWKEILDDVYIISLPASYNGQINPTNGKLCVESWKIPCPNRANHGTHRDGDISAELAILCKYSDGTDSCTCNHNSCDPLKHPNLLRRLWDEIYKIKADRALEIIRGKMCETEVNYDL